MTQVALSEVLGVLCLAQTLEIFVRTVKAAAHGWTADVVASADDACLRPPLRRPA